MKIVAVNGGYRVGRTTDTAVAEILRAAQEAGAQTKELRLMDLRIEFCTNCRACTQPSQGLRGRCFHDDDMEMVLGELESADGIVLASPTNFYTVTAVMKRFIERLIVYADWVWGTMPKERSKARPRKAVTVTSTACPGPLARVMLPSAPRVLKAGANCLGAKVIKSLYFGTVAQSPEYTLSEGQRRKAYAAGKRLVS